jgi:PQQ-dependent catabolism-associated CXXCW motif protein
MRWRNALTAIVFIAVNCFSVAAFADKRVALIVGIDHYSKGNGPISAPDLANPINDARAIRDTLVKLGFNVVYGEDLKRDEFEADLDSFEDQAKDADLALVYFSGHGSTFDNQPYLVPADAAFDELRKAERSVIPVEDVLARLRQAKGVRIALFDACRDNAAEQALKQNAAKTRAVAQERGLARVASADGLIVMYAAQHLQTAKDGSDDHSPFAAALLSEITVPNVDVTEMLNNVARSVIHSTNGAQKPELVIDLFDKFTLVTSQVAASTPSVPAAAPQAPSVTVDPRLAEAALIWPSLSVSTDKNALTEFQKRYAGTIYATMAEDKLASLQDAQAPTRPPPPTSTAPTGQQNAALEMPEVKRSVLNNPAFVRTYGEETKDWSVAAQATLQPSNAIGTPTPTSIPGATIISTGEVAALVATRQVPFALLDALDSPHKMIFGAVNLAGAGRDGTMSDATQTWLAGRLNELTAGKTGFPLIFYCAGAQCWEGYNAALRARQAGYTNVYWYRGGLAAWQLSPLAGVYRNAAFARTFGEEATDWGVPPQSGLRPNFEIGTPTPTTIPGGSVLTTGEVRAGFSTAHVGVLIDVWSAPHSLIPSAINMAGMGSGGSYLDNIQKIAAARLQQITGGNIWFPLVFYCQGPRCWEGYNAGLRAIHAGYRNVYWYRGGVASWSLVR